MYVSVDEAGAVESVSYNSQIDLDATFEENLDRVERDFEALNAPLASLAATVAASTPALFTVHTLSDEFREAFLSGSLYEEIRVTEDVGAGGFRAGADSGAVVDGDGRVDGDDRGRGGGGVDGNAVTVSCSFYTSGEDEFTEYTRPRVMLLVSAR